MHMRAAFADLFLKLGPHSWKHMWYDQAESVVCRQYWFYRYSPSKKITSFVSYCFSQPTFTHISGTKWPIFMGFSAKCSVCDVV